MTVKDLIIRLSDLPQEAVVKVYSEYEGEKVNVDVIVGGLKEVTLIAD